MKKWKECPIYIWIFSFFALIVLIWITMFQFMLLMPSFFRGKFPFNCWISFPGEFFFDILFLFMLPHTILSYLIPVLSLEIWNWMSFPTAYLLGIYPAVRLWNWRKNHRINDRER